MTDKKEPMVFTSSFTRAAIDIYISGSIDAPEQYLDELQALREAQESDTVRIYINSVGGYVSTAVQIVNAIRNCKASVTAVLEGECHSAAGYIFLACDNWEVNQGVLMLIHNYSGGAYGKGGDLVDNVRANDKWVKSIMSVAYEGFLSKSELDQVNLNQDIWLETEEILERLETLSTLREAQAEEQVEAMRQEAIATVKEYTNDV